MLIDFLKTKRSKKNLGIALEILREFKEGESEEEWLYCSFIAWAKLDNA